MTKEDILDYVMNTPNNANRMVLNDMLNELQGFSGNCLIVEAQATDSGYVLNKTAGEIINAMPIAFVKYDTNNGDVSGERYQLISSYYVSPASRYVFGTIDADFVAESLESYPAGGGNNGDEGDGR